MHLMLYREIIAVCTEIHTEHKNKRKIFVPGGTYSNHWAIKCSFSIQIRWL